MTLKGPLSDHAEGQPTKKLGRPSNLAIRKTDNSGADVRRFDRVQVTEEIVRQIQTLLRELPNAFGESKGGFKSEAQQVCQ